MAIIKIRNAAIDLDAAEIPNLPASKITSGTLDNARISLDAAEIPNLDTAKITTGTLADARVPNLNASKITAGTIATARLGSGTASSSTFLRGDNTFAGAGITEADNWRISSTQSISADTDTVVNSSWERNDNNSDKIGTGLTESSGVFTFPSTGIYLISYQQNIARTGDSRYFTGSIELSTDSGSNYSLVARSYTHIKQTSSETSANSSTSCTIDVTNASTFRFRLQAGGDETFTLRASSSYQITGFYCLRLGDT